MEHFRFTLFNGITLAIMALTVAVAVARWRASPRSNWPLVYYAVVAAYTFGFDGSFHKRWLAIGVLCGLLIRLTGLAAARAVEAVFFAYVLWRSVALLLMW